MSVYEASLPVIESLILYSPPSGNQVLFGASGTDIYDFTTSSTALTPVDSGYTNVRFQNTQIGTSGGNFLFICNGVDTPRTYNGSVWADSTITGPAIDNLIWCNNHQRRLVVGEANKLSFWYGPVDTLGGAFTEFSIAALASMGGYIMAMGTWSRDSGDGADDLAVFLTSEGEAIVYQGTDPSDPAEWSLIGVYRIGKPIGRRCFIKAGADLLIITQDGFVAASSILSIDRSQTEKVALSQQINKAVNDYVRLYSSLHGWEAFLYPYGTMLIFNIPTSETTADQCVFNTITKAPCRFTGIAARCWALLNDEAYFGGADGIVYKFDFGQSDNGENISGDVVQAFNYFGAPQVYKYFKLVEPVYQSDGNPSTAVDLCYDYNITSSSAVPDNVTNNNSLWGFAVWGESLWGGGSEIYRRKRGVRGRGRAAALRIRIRTNTVRPSLIATNLVWVPGGYL